MRSIFLLDTSVIVAAYIAQDTGHKRAIKLLSNCGDNVLINQFILAEVSTVLLYKTKQLTLVREVTQLYQPLVWHHPKLFSISMEIFLQQRSGQLSVADCSLLAQQQLTTQSSIITLDQRLHHRAKQLKTNR